jgi:hypothetical protein
MYGETSSLGTGRALTIFVEIRCRTGPGVL